MTPAEQIAVVIAGGVGLVAVRWVFIWSVKALAAQIVKAINGQLGLTQIREDVSILKLQFDDMEKQFEKILTEL